MNQEERVANFLKALTELTAKYELSITAEGTSPYLYDELSDDFAPYFIYSNGKYKAVGS